MLKAMQLFNELAGKGQYGPDFSKDFSQQDERDAISSPQKPHTLWYGCSDSRVVPNLIAGMGAGELFVHRNIANQVKRDDNGAMAVLEFAIEVLKVKHIVVCGHYECGGIMAALDRKTDAPKPITALEHWIEEIAVIRDGFSKELQELENDHARTNFLCEKNVLHQTAIIKSHPLVENNADIQVFSLIFDLKTGTLHNLGEERSQISQTGSGS